jgi:hypothetical protein
MVYMRVLLRAWKYGSKIEVLLIFEEVELHSVLSNDNAAYRKLLKAIGNLILFNYLLPMGRY